MGIIQAFRGAISGTFADQWKDIFTAPVFDEHVVVMPAIQKSFNNGRGTNYKGSNGVISNGSKIYVPENTAAFIFSQSGIEEIIYEAGGYEYQNGQSSIFSGGGITKSLFQQVAKRVGYGGITDEYKKIVFVNLREIRDIKFGTKGAQLYNDLYYGTDLEIFASGTFTIKISDITLFIKNFLPANTMYYSFDDEKVRSQILSEFLQSFLVALNSMSIKYRISQLPSQANVISNTVKNDRNVGTWGERYGFTIVKVAIHNIELTEESRQLVKKYTSNKIEMKAYENVSQKTSNIVAQQKIAEGLREHGFGETGNMILGMNMANGVNTFGGNIHKNIEISIDYQIDTMKKLKELLDIGILSEEEFNLKKKEIMGL